MAKPVCECGHEKRDHRAALLGSGVRSGECKVCLCREYVKNVPAVVAPVVVAP
jgi:hypothetical protein